MIKCGAASAVRPGITGTPFEAAAAAAAASGPARRAASGAGAKRTHAGAGAWTTGTVTSSRPGYERTWDSGTSLSGEREHLCSTGVHQPFRFFSSSTQCSREAQAEAPLGAVVNGPGGR